MVIAERALRLCIGGLGSDDNLWRKMVRETSLLVFVITGFMFRRRAVGWVCPL